MLRRTGVLALLALTVPALAACTAVQPAAPAADVAPSVRVALLPTTDVVPFYVAQAQGYYADAGVNVELTPVASAAERDTVVQTGDAQCEMTDLHGVVLTNAAGALQLRAVSSVLAATPEQGQFFLLASAQSGVATPDGLAGKTIAISENTIIEYWLDRMLAEHGLAPDQVRKTNVPQLPVRLELLLSGQVDAAILPNPLAALAQLQGAALVADDTVRPDLGLSVLVCRQDAIEGNRAAVEGLVAAFDRAVEAINADPTQFNDILIQQARVPEPLQGQYQLPVYPVQGLPSAEQVQDVVDWAVEKGYISAPLSYEQVVDGSFRR